MKDILQDLVAHTLPLEVIQLLKITSSDEETLIEAVADDRSIVFNAKTKTPVADFSGVFGMPNLNKLDIHLKCPEYKENAKHTIEYSQKNGEKIPSSLHFENEAGDFQNDYRFMSTEIVNSRLQSVKFKGAAWEVNFNPQVGSIMRLKLQANAHNDETIYQVTTDNGNLVFSFGDASTHAGSFIFEHGVAGKLKQTWSWPVKQTLSILGLTGDINMKISDSGVMQITVDSGIAEYTYILPAQTK